jgi:L-threonylcarbamoyladenylate synthase
MENLKINSRNFAGVIKKVVESIKRGDVVIFPTDTVPGLICDAKNKKAVERLFKIKNRPENKPLPVFVEDIKMTKELAVINKDQEKILKKVWPGKVTIVLKSKIQNPKSKIYGVAKNTIALRIPKHKFLNILLKEINLPLAQSSVNISGEPAAKDIKHAVKIFEKRKYKPNLIIDDGILRKSQPSKIIDLSGQKIKILRK